MNYARTALSSAGGGTTSVAAPTRKKAVILGAGLAGLSAGYVLSNAGMRLDVLEGASVVGGLSKTFSHKGFLFDLGGHRFIAKNKQTEQFVLDLLDGKLLQVPRKSKIYMRDRFFDYPLRPANALFGMGVSTTLAIVFDYYKEKARNMVRRPDIVSLEDWVVSRFGRKMFQLYFKGYSEKVWGIDCREISMEWVAQRIRGLSLGAAIKNALCKFSGKNLLTLSSTFYYPALGIGQLSLKLQEKIEEDENAVRTDTRAIRIHHRNSYITGIDARNRDCVHSIQGDEFISSIPLTNLVRMLQPAAPADVLEAADQLRYRDIVIVTVMLDRESVTDLTWMYLPGSDIPFGRIHEPKNWSPHMAPEGKTHIVAEYFCFRGDEVWNASDEDLTSMTVKHLERLDFIEADEVIGSCVLKRPKAYPLLEVGYHDYYNKILEYLHRFKNLHIIGRSGKFKYYNMDHAMESGFEVAESILRKGSHATVSGDISRRVTARNSS